MWISSNSEYTNKEPVQRYILYQMHGQHSNSKPYCLCDWLVRTKVNSKTKNTLRTASTIKLTHVQDTGFLHSIHDFYYTERWHLLITSHLVHFFQLPVVQIQRLEIFITVKWWPNKSHVHCPKCTDISVGIYKTSLMNVASRARTYLLDYN